MKLSALQWRDLAEKAIYKMDKAVRDRSRQDRGKTMWRLIKILFYLAILCGLALVAYAYLGPVFFPADFSAPSTETRVPVVLDLD